MKGRRALGVLPCALCIGCGALPEAPTVTHADVVAAEGAAVICTPIGAGERFAAASPEGHAWFVADNGVNTVVRVVDPFVAGPDVVRALEVVGVLQVRAWSGSEATLLTPTTVWQLGTDFVRTRVSTPDGFDGRASSCGDLWQDGFVALPDRLVRHRGGAVFSWAFGEQGALPESLLARDGACVGPDGVLWGIEGDGTLWNIDDTGAQTMVQIGDWVAAAAAAEEVAVVTPYTLWMGTPGDWRGVVLAGELPERLSAGGTDLWMVRGDELLRSRHGVFESMPSPLDEGEPVVELEAHAAGVWVLGERQACHVALGPTVRVHGVRPHWRTRDGGFGFEVEGLASSPGEPAPADLEVRLDDEPVTVAEAEGGRRLVEGRLEGNRWHRFDFVLDGTERRSLFMERAPALVHRSWKVDLRPLYQTGCTGSGCHNPGVTSPVDLSSHAAWVEHADAIRQRVVVAQSMPPASGPQADRWGAAEVEIVSEWLEGGMNE